MLFYYCSLQRRINPQDIDNEALAFRPVLGSMLARIYHNPLNKDENQSRLQKILQFWASKEVYDHDTICALESEMLGGPPKSSFPRTPNELSVNHPTGTGTLSLSLPYPFQLCSYKSHHSIGLFMQESRNWHRIIMPYIGSLINFLWCQIYRLQNILISNFLLYQQ